MEFKDPLVLLLIPAVLALWWYLNRKRVKPALVFSSLRLFEGVHASWKVRFAFIPLLLRLIAVVCVIVALAGPRRVLSETLITGEGIDIVLALDVSGSMAAEDFTINAKRLNRLDVIKNVVEEFISQRKFDQLGLIAFAARAYTVCPLTLDHDWLLTNLRRIKLGIIEDGTAIGSGISSAVLKFKNSKAKSKVLVLLTDGMNNAGSVDPLVAAKTAKTLGVKIYTIGAGTNGLAPFPVGDMFGRKVYQQIQINIDEPMLTQVAELTGGKYFRAIDTDSLRSVYSQIDQLEKSAIEQRGYKQYQPLFIYFLIASFALLSSELFLINTLLLRIP